jgi:hypothetical protein
MCVFSMCKFRKAVLFAAGLVLGGGVLGNGVFARAGSLLTFEASPTSPGLPEVIWTNTPLPQLIAGPGAVGNDDGTLPPFQQSPGGLEIQTPLSITAPGSHPLIGGGTEVDDVTLVLTNFLATAPASSQGGGVLVQRFAPGDLENFGSFSLLSDDPDGSDGGQPTVLLSGRVTGGSITALNGGDSGSVLSADVTYTGGAIFDALQASGGATTGSLSWSILDATSLLDGSPSITINPATGFLVPFSANATGLFSVSVPEPTTAAVMGVSALGMLARRRRV